MIYEAWLGLLSVLLLIKSFNSRIMNWGNSVLCVCWWRRVSRNRSWSIYQGGSTFFSTLFISPLVKGLSWDVIPSPHTKIQRDDRYGRYSWTHYLHLVQNFIFIFQGRNTTDVWSSKNEIIPWGRITEVHDLKESSRTIIGAGIDMTSWCKRS